MIRKNRLRTDYQAIGILIYEAREENSRIRTLPVQRSLQLNANGLSSSSSIAQKAVIVQHHSKQSWSLQDIRGKSAIKNRLREECPKLGISVSRVSIFNEQHGSFLSKKQASIFDFFS